MTHPPGDQHRRVRPDAAWRVTGHAAVRAAAKDWERYSSDLQGDRDVRTYRQLPLETDPPRHTAYREALQPLFARSALSQHHARFEKLARSLIEGLTARGGGDVVADVALPYVVGCLSIVFNRPQDYNEWLSWGPDVWAAGSFATRWVAAEPDIHGDGPYVPIRERRRSGASLHAYLDRVLKHARLRRDDPNATGTDIWDTLAGLQVDGVTVDDQEMLGMASVLLAGGRDTLAKLVTGIVWRLIADKRDRAYLSSHETAIDSAIAELIRYFTPLPHIERKIPENAEAANGHTNQRTSAYGQLDFASANHDPTMWTNADQIDIQRRRQPHLGFGFGRHSCLGKTLAEAEATAFLRALLTPWPDWRFGADPVIDWLRVGTEERSKVIAEFRYVPVVAPHQ